MLLDADYTSEDAEKVRHCAELFQLIDFHILLQLCTNGSIEEDTFVEHMAGCTCNMSQASFQKVITRAAEVVNDAHTQPQQLTP